MVRINMGGVLWLEEICGNLKLQINKMIVWCFYFLSGNGDFECELKMECIFYFLFLIVMVEASTTHG
jgi:hypothetical protein